MVKILNLRKSDKMETYIEIEDRHMNSLAIFNGPTAKDDAIAFILSVGGDDNIVIYKCVKNLLRNGFTQSEEIYGLNELKKYEVIK